VCHFCREDINKNGHFTPFFEVEFVGFVELLLGLIFKIEILKIIENQCFMFDFLL
jgi:hypothetical protein